MDPQESPIVAIVGPTASGKSDLAMKLARKYRGEIVSADSRTVYKGMDIGTAKPSAEDRALVPHHCLDLVEPDQTFSAADFKREALQSIKEIHENGHIPFLVGGTGLYVDAVLYDFKFGSKPNPQTRSRLESMSLEQLQQEAQNLGIGENEINFANRRHLSRAIERGGVVSQNKALRANTLVLGMDVDKEVLKKRIITRVDQMLESGFIEELKLLQERYGQETEALKAPGYKAFSEYLTGKISLEEAKNQFVNNDLSLAKRQRTWFKRNADIFWVQTFDQADKAVAAFLSKFGTINK